MRMAVAGDRSCRMNKEECQSPVDVAAKCQEKPEVYSRVCGFFRPVQGWHKGKQEEFKDRTPYKVKDD